MNTAPKMISESHRVIRSGYLVKSPPVEGRNKLIPKRWMLRWFVLYECGVTQDLKDSRNAVAGQGYKLLYFKDHRSCSRGESALGEINLNGASVRAYEKPLHGYRYVIKLRSQCRKYFLCTTCFEVHRAWLEKLSASLSQMIPEKVATDERSRGSSSSSAQSSPANSLSSWDNQVTELIKYGRTQFVRVNGAQAQGFHSSGFESERFPGHRSMSLKSSKENVEEVEDNVFSDSSDSPMLGSQNLRFTVSKIPCLPEVEEDQVEDFEESFARDSGFISSSSDEDISVVRSQKAETSRTRTRFSYDEIIGIQSERLSPSTRRKITSLPITSATLSDDHVISKPRSGSVFVADSLAGTLLSGDDRTPPFTGPRLKPSMKSLSKSSTNLATRADSFIRALPPGPARDSLMLQFSRASRMNPTMFEAAY